MKYPILTETKATDISNALISGQAVNINAELQWIGQGSELDLTELKSVCQDMRARFETESIGKGSSYPEEFEGEACGELHLIMREFPTNVLDDPGFWRYISLSHLWWFIAVREATPIASGNVMKYVNGSHPTECVPMRMFLRAQAIRDGNDYSLASSLSQATDFWRSHVIRVKTGSAPTLARSFASLQSEVKMKTTPELRPYARTVNKMWQNIVFHRLEESESRNVLDELYDKLHMKKELE